ncbi:MAG: DUF6607 family protein [Pseudomonadota bacterium]
MKIAAMRKVMVAAAFVVMANAGAEDANPSGPSRQFTFSWQFHEAGSMSPRGGTTKGPAVSLDTAANPAWLALQEPGLSAQERDRRAILAMAGGFRTSFEFIETVGFVDGHSPDRPYQSWGTEYVYVVEDEPDFVSLQHIIVMFFKGEDGEVMGPAVVKHWRQDWQYEDRELHVYVGHDTWERRKLQRRDVRGTWSQAVYQVDDSPRYQATGRWTHAGNHSSWMSESTWRPLPRREYSVRDDYHVLHGTNRHTITPTGWVQEEHNLKLVLNGDGSPRAENPYLAKEAGLNRYERIVDHDFSGGDTYWSTTAPFWADVREGWAKIFNERDRFSIRSSVDGKRLFETMFGYASRLESSDDYDPDDAKQFIADTFLAYLD